MYDHGSVHACQNCHNLYSVFDAEYEDTMVSIFLLLLIVTVVSSMGIIRGAAHVSKCFLNNHNDDYISNSIKMAITYCQYHNNNNHIFVLKYIM